MILFTEDDGHQLFLEGKSFYAENITEENFTGYEIEVQDTVKLSIQYEKDGKSVYLVEPHLVKTVKAK